MEGIFNKVAEVRNGGLVEELQWDGRDGFILIGTFAAMGQRTEVEKTRREACRDLLAWGELLQTEEEFEVVFADEEALGKIMEGWRWLGLRQTH